MSEVFLTREEIEHPYANLAVMIEDKRKKAEQMRRTVFARITASPEVLAEKLVYKALAVGNNRVTYSCWKSTITEESYRTKEEAVSATVAKLKEAIE